MIGEGVDRSLLDSLARQMRGESCEELGARVRNGIPAVLPHDPGGTEMRVPTTRQFQEAWVAAQELERRARGLAGEPEPRPIYEVIVASHSQETPEGVTYVHQPRPEKPPWWDDPVPAPEYPIVEDTPAPEPETPDQEPPSETEMLAEKIRNGMPRLVPDTKTTQRWHVPLAHELADAQLALDALLERVGTSDDDPAS